jgi:redox-sensitive bicupin YhaK (pirin superfamily)
MTAGRGISHSEFSTPETTVLHGAQLWIALPDKARHMAPTFAHFKPEPMGTGDWTVRVFLGSLSVSGNTGAEHYSISPVATHTELVGAEILMEPGTRIKVALKAHHEHGILLDSGSLKIDADDLPLDNLAFLPAGYQAITITAGNTPVRALLIGGEPLHEQILMWWNFVGRTHEEIVKFRAQWQAEIGAEPGDTAVKRFGEFPDGEPAALPAPVLPTVRLRPRD